MIMATIRESYPTDEQQKLKVFQIIITMKCNTSIIS